MSQPDDVAMQARCVHCLAEQYVLNVLAVSLGDGECAWCGRKSRQMTHREYTDALAERKKERGQWFDE